MSENQSSKPAPHADNKASQGSRIGDIEQPLADSEKQMTIESAQPGDVASKGDPAAPPALGDTDPRKKTVNECLAADNWETAHLPGTVDVKVADVKLASGASPAGIASDLDSARESELLMLIHDLNECNDVLLSRVAQLETALGDSQRLLQEADERSRAEKDKIAEQLSAEQLSAQQVSQNAQQQVARLVAKLETAEQSLQRQQLINETLQSEVNNAQEQVSQLEHDCAMSAQKHAEEAQARVQAETTIRDLRSRLQRQQRYTLQFKAALEKSLTVTARSAGSAMQGDSRPQTLHATAKTTSFSAPSPTGGGVTMPRAQRIMPWAGAVTSPFEGIDPHLESLIRGVGASKAVQDSNPVSSMPLEPHGDSPSAVQSSLAAVAAEDKLWQDMERVIENSTGVTTPDTSADVKGNEKDMSESVVVKSTEAILPEEIAEAATTDEQADETSKERLTEEISLEEIANVTTQSDVLEVSTEVIEKNIETSEFSSEAEAGASGPRLNWQRKSDGSEEQEPAQEPLIQALEQKLPSDRAVVIDPYTVSEGQKPTDNVGFTEPSPWGKPLMEKALTQAVHSAGSLAANSNANEYLPAIDGEVSDIAPKVNPLRAQKKIGSMSAVQLPTFQKARAGSFKR